MAVAFFRHKDCFLLLSVSCIVCCRFCTGYFWRKGRRVAVDGILLALPNHAETCRRAREPGGEFFSTKLNKYELSTATTYFFPFFHLVRSWEVENGQGGLVRSACMGGSEVGEWKQVVWSRRLGYILVQLIVGGLDFLLCIFARKLLQPFVLRGGLDHQIVGQSPDSIALQLLNQSRVLHPRILPKLDSNDSPQVVSLGRVARDVSSQSEAVAIQLNSVARERL